MLKKEQGDNKKSIKGWPHPNYGSSRKSKMTARSPMTVEAKRATNKAGRKPGNKAELPRTQEAEKTARKW